MWVRSPHPHTYNICKTFPQIADTYAESVINRLAVIAKNTNKLQLWVERLVEQTDPHCDGTQPGKLQTQWLAKWQTTLPQNVNTQPQDIKPVNYSAAQTGKNTNYGLIVRKMSLYG